MNKAKKVVERRQHKRFQVQSGAFVGVGPRFNQVGPLIDMSMDGLAFRYRAHVKQSSGLSLDIFLTDRDFYLDYVPFKTVCDVEVDGRASSSSPPMRRSSVQFGKLTPDQKSQIEYLISCQTMGE